MWQKDFNQRAVLEHSHYVTNQRRRDYSIPKNTGAMLGNFRISIKGILSICNIARGLGTIRNGFPYPVLPKNIAPEFRTLLKYLTRYYGTDFFRIVILHLSVPIT